MKNKITTAIVIAGFMGFGAWFVAQGEDRPVEAPSEIQTTSSDTEPAGCDSLRDMLERDSKLTKAQVDAGLAEPLMERADRHRQQMTEMGCKQ